MGVVYNPWKFGGDRWYSIWDMRLGTEPVAYFRLRVSEKTSTIAVATHSTYIYSINMLMA